MPSLPKTAESNWINFLSKRWFIAWGGFAGHRCYWVIRFRGSQLPSGGLNWTGMLSPTILLLILGPAGSWAQTPCFRKKGSDFFNFTQQADIGELPLSLCQTSAGFGIGAGRCFQDQGACKFNPNLDMSGITLTLPFSSPSAPGRAAPSPLHPGWTMASGGSSRLGSRFSDVWRTHSRVRPAVGYPHFFGDTSPPLT